MTTRKKGMYLLALPQLWPFLQRGPWAGAEKALSEFQVGEVIRGPYRPAPYGSSAHGGRGAAGRARPRQCPGARRALRRALPRPLLRAPPHGRAAAPPAAVTAAAPPAASFSYFRPPSPSFLVCFCLFVFFPPSSYFISCRCPPRAAERSGASPGTAAARECLRPPPKSTAPSPTPGSPRAEPTHARGAPFGPGPPLGAGGGAHLPGADPGSARPPGRRAGKRRPGPRRRGQVTSSGGPRAVSPRGAGREPVCGAAPLASPFPQPRPAEGRRWGLLSRRWMRGGRWGLSVRGRLR